MFFFVYTQLILKRIMYTEQTYKLFGSNPLYEQYKELLWKNKISCFTCYNMHTFESVLNIYYIRGIYWAWHQDKNQIELDKTA